MPVAAGRDAGDGPAAGDDRSNADGGVPKAPTGVNRLGSEKAGNAIEVRQALTIKTETSVSVTAE